MTLSPLVTMPGRRVVVPPAYCGSVRRYAAICQAEGVAVDTTRRFNKREKLTHRCTISGPNGLQRLTVPLEKPQEWHSTRLEDVRVSTHGDWWLVHWGAICAAYGRTPFFEYYADDLLPAYSGTIERLVDLDSMIDRFCRKALGLPVDDDLSLPVAPMPEVRDVPYYQMWASRFGFVRDLSVLDLLFNMGPESPLVLRAMRMK